MPPTASWRGPDRGQVEQFYVVRCADCVQLYSPRAVDGVLSVELAVRWIREEGWSLGGDKRWRCSDCAAKRRKAQRKA